MNFLADYGMFLAKIATFVIAFLIIATTFFNLASKSKQRARLIVKELNEDYEETKTCMDEIILSKDELKKTRKQIKQAHKQHDKTSKPHLFVLNFDGDIKASAVGALREEITAILLSARPQDEVLVRLESPGGLVNAYGLAASQLQRIKDAKLKLTIAVDKVAASGGYMMACVADQIIAAPFAIIGSIGVIAQLPNFHRWLEKNHIDFEQITAGEYKRTLSLFGENTRKGRDKMQEEVENTQELFKLFIQKHRPSVDLNTVATGEYWYASHAMALQLVDALQTSDDFLLQAKERCDLYEIQYKIKKSLGQRLTTAATVLYSKLVYHNSCTH